MRSDAGAAFEPRRLGDGRRRQVPALAWVATLGVVVLAGLSGRVDAGSDGSWRTADAPEGSGAAPSGVAAQSPSVGSGARGPSTPGRRGPSISDTTIDAATERTLLRGYRPTGPLARAAAPAVGE